jgi:hypothetical protein
MKIRLEIVALIGAAAVGSFLLYQNWSGAQAANAAFDDGGNNTDPIAKPPELDPSQMPVNPPPGWGTWQPITMYAGGSNTFNEASNVVAVPQAAAVW